MPDWQFWALAAWSLAILLRIERVNNSVKDIKRDLAKQVEGNRQKTDSPDGESVEDVEDREL